jgi:hypothetical protein
MGATATDTVILRAVAMGFSIWSVEFLWSDHNDLLWSNIFDQGLKAVRRGRRHHGGASRKGAGREKSAGALRSGMSMPLNL